MADKKFTLKDFINNKHKKTEVTSSKPKKRTGGLADSWFTAGTGGNGSGTGDAGGIGESLISELFSGMSSGASPTTLNMRQAPLAGSQTDAGMTTYPSADPAEEEAEQKSNKVDQARQLFTGMIDHPNATRADIINRFMKEVGVTNSTAVSYYTRFMKESGRSHDDTPDVLGQGTEMGSEDLPDRQPTGHEALTPPTDDVEMEDPIDPNRAGIIRTVDNAHLVYKRQAEDGSYEELWIFNIHDSTNDELDIRRDILAGTDIPVKKTKSPDGQQSYTIITMGNAQMMKLSGLHN
jgi:hypothetical protein